jgi:hypothetical protein
MGQVDLSLLLVGELKDLMGLLEYLFDLDCQFVLFSLVLLVIHQYHVILVNLYLLEVLLFLLGLAHPGKHPGHDHL